ncbi:LysR family transcriptional regulator [Chitinivorax sp. B]|uniref:LysR family transcriptional regulator n=1 Tax=Chitinivorax sp. B TaxID=2502235 RepID=UPI0010F473DE|nr:LysR family transcriptional regulator [Chitinivorax sp. B]
MTTPDFNLLLTLDALLTESSVARAARRLHLSPSAMSRALARLRDTMGDPLLVRAGRGLVPTPRALEIRDQVSELVQGIETVLRPAEKLDLAQLVRTFSMRTSEGFAETFGPRLIARINAEAPGVRLHFVQKPNKDSTPLRNGTIDLETGVVDLATAPELRTQALFRDRFIGAVRRGHPLCKQDITPEHFAAGGHVYVSRRGLDKGSVDQALQQIGLQRRILTIVDGFATALALARNSDLIATVPERHTDSLRDGMYSFPMPVPTPEITISMLWHPRQDADLAHRWFRACVRDVCTKQIGEQSTLPINDTIPQWDASSSEQKAEE